MFVEEIIILILEQHISLHIQQLPLWEWQLFKNILDKVDISTTC